MVVRHYQDCLFLIVIPVCILVKTHQRFGVVFLPVVLGRSGFVMGLLAVWQNLWIPSQNVSEYSKLNTREQRGNKLKHLNS